MSRVETAQDGDGRQDNCSYCQHVQAGRADYGPMRPGMAIVVIGSPALQDAVPNCSDKWDDERKQENNGWGTQKQNRKQST